MPKLILQVDASALKYSHCALKLFRTVVQGYRGHTRLNDIEYGSAFHKFADTYTQTEGDSFLAMDAAHKYYREVSSLPNYVVKEKKEWLNITHLTQTCMQWMNAEGSRMFLPGTDLQVLRHPTTGKSLSETKFRVPWYTDEHVEICLSGTIDFLGYNSRTKQLIFRDYKTTSMWDIQSYLDNYALSPQLMFYVLALTKFAEMFPASVIGQVVGQQPRIGAQIQGLFVTGTKGKDTQIVNSQVFQFSQERMTEFKEMVDMAVKKIAFNAIGYTKYQEIPWREGMLNDTCEMKFGKCPFYGTCKLDDESARQQMLSQFFDQKPYDPLSFGTVPELIKKEETL